MRVVKVAFRTAQLLTALLLASCGGGGSNLPAQQILPPPSAINMDQVLDNFIANNSNVPSLAMLVVRDGAITSLPTIPASA